MGGDAPENWDWTGIPDASIREIVRQGEARLADLLSVSIASDQRATTLGSAFGALAAGLFAADATLLTIQKFDTAVAIGLGITAFGSLVASLLCFYAGRPIDYFVGGYEPQRLLPSATDEMWLLRYISQDIQKRIHFDKLTLARSARVTTLATIVEILAILLGGTAFVVLHVVA